MAATKLTPVRVPQTGIAVSAGTAADLTNGNEVPNLASVRLEIKNAGAGPVTVTFTTSATVEGYAVADYTASVAAGETKVFGKFSRTLFGDSVGFLCSDAATVSVYS